MRVLFTFWIICCMGCSAFGQQSPETSPVQSSFPHRFSFDGLHYPEGVNGEKRHVYRIDYKISDDFRLRLETFYNKFGTRNRLRTAFVVKTYLTKKFYVFGGPEVEYDLNREMGAQGPNDYLRIGINGGMGYELQENWLLEAGFNKDLNQSKIGPYGTVGSSDVLTIGSRFKF